MIANRVSYLPLLLCIAMIYVVQTPAQGGWRQWDIYMRDGTRLLATPLGVRADGLITRSMGDEAIERSKISYIAARADSLPAMPAGDFAKDLIVLLDGTRTLGPVTFVNVKWSEGTVMQNGRKIDLRDVAYIKFAPRKSDEPVAGGADRKAILAALRQQVKKLHKIDAMFVVNYLKVQKGWAWIETMPRSRHTPDQYEPVSALMRKRSGRWQLAEIPCTEEGNRKCLGADDYFIRLRKRFPAAPKAIFPTR